MLMGASEMELERETGREAGREPTMAGRGGCGVGARGCLRASEDEKDEGGSVERKEEKRVNRGSFMRFVAPACEPWMSVQKPVHRGPPRLVTGVLTVWVARGKTHALRLAE